MTAGLRREGNMRRKIVLLTTVLILASESVATAECAWVLWVELDPREKKE